jgi:hypothetical protein
MSTREQRIALATKQVTERPAHSSRGNDRRSRT